MIKTHIQCRPLRRQQQGDKSFMNAGDELRAPVALERGDALAVRAVPSADVKCDRCWHWRSDVGVDAEHPALCGRCVANLFGPGEPRVHA